MLTLHYLFLLSIKIKCKQYEHKIYSSSRSSYVTSELQIVSPLWCAPLHPVLSSEQDLFRTRAEPASTAPGNTLHAETLELHEWTRNLPYNVKPHVKSTWQYITCFNGRTRSAKTFPKTPDRLFVTKGLSSATHSCIGVRSSPKSALPGRADANYRGGALDHDWSRMAPNRMWSL